MSAAILQQITAWKVSKCGVFSGSYFPAFGLNTERYAVNVTTTGQCVYEPRFTTQGHSLHSKLYKSIWNIFFISLTVV